MVQRAELRWAVSVNTGIVMIGIYFEVSIISCEHSIISLYFLWFVKTLTKSNLFIYNLVIPTWRGTWRGHSVHLPGPETKTTTTAAACSSNSNNNNRLDRVKSLVLTKWRPHHVYWLFKKCQNIRSQKYGQCRPQFVLTVRFYCVVFVFLFVLIVIVDSGMVEWCVNIITPVRSFLEPSQLHRECATRAAKCVAQQA